VDVVGAGPVDAVPLVTPNSGFPEPGTRSKITPVAIHWNKKLLQCKPPVISKNLRMNSKKEKNDQE
jgi:hypothetical protein